MIAALAHPAWGLSGVGATVSSARWGSAAFRGLQRRVWGEATCTDEEAGGAVWRGGALRTCRTSDCVEEGGPRLKGRGAQPKGLKLQGAQG